MPHSTTSVTSEHSTYLKLSVLSFGLDASTDWQLCKIHAYMPSCHRSSKTPTRPWTSGQAQSCLFACESLRGLHDSILSKISLYSVWAIAFRSGSCPRSTAWLRHGPHTAKLPESLHFLSVAHVSSRVPHCAMAHEMLALPIQRSTGTPSTPTAKAELRSRLCVLKVSIFSCSTRDQSSVCQGSHYGNRTT